MPEPRRLDDGRIAQHFSWDEVVAGDKQRRREVEAKLRTALIGRPSLTQRLLEYGRKIFRPYISTVRKLGR